MPSQRKDQVVDVMESAKLHAPLPGRIDLVAAVFLREGSAKLPSLQGLCGIKENLPSITCPPRGGNQDDTSGAQHGVLEQHCSDASAHLRDRRVET